MPYFNKIVLMLFVKLSSYSYFSKMLDAINRLIINPLIGRNIKVIYSSAPLSSVMYYRIYTLL